MRFSSAYIKTKREVSSEIESKNGQLLAKASFIHQEMAGVYTLLPLGLKVINKIENIVRKHMDTIGSELLMSGLSPKSNWEITNRLNSVDVLFKVSGANEMSVKKNDSEYILNPTHEDMITPLVKESVFSYKDLPFAMYQIQTKYRNEPRAKSGLMRTREFKMKDLYSFHLNELDLMEYYEKAKEVYMNIFKDLGMGDDTYVTLASGGDFTTNFSHEFQFILESGEDLIYLDKKNNIAYNKEIVNEENSKKLNVDFSKLEEVKASEVGNIFPLGTIYSKAINFSVLDEKGNKNLVWMGSYGIGISRLMGVIAEKYGDNSGLIWPESIAPFKYHLISITKDNKSKVFEESSKIYNELKERGVEVLWDDRLDTNTGEKFADSDLIGIPNRLVVSEKTLEKNKIELKKRDKQEAEFVDSKSIV